MTLFSKTCIELPIGSCVTVLTSIKMCVFYTSVVPLPVIWKKSCAEYVSYLLFNVA